MDKTVKTGSRKWRPLPFKVYRNITDNLSDQVADGLRQAILTGYYRKGKMLPKFTEMARTLGVSMRRRATSRSPIRSGRRRSSRIRSACCAN